MKMTEHQVEVINKLKEGYHIQVNRTNGRARAIKDNSTEVIHINRAAFNKFVNHEVVECSVINKAVVHYKLRDGVYV